MVSVDIERIWKTYDKIQRKIVLYIVHMNPPISIDVLMSLSEAPVLTVLNVLEGLKKKKVLSEKRGYQKGLYFLADNRLQDFIQNAVPDDEMQQIIKGLIEYYKQHQDKIDEKNIVLADLYEKLDDIKEGLDVIKSAADTFVHAGEIERGIQFYDRILEYFENREPTPENADIFLESVLAKLSMSKQLRPYSEQMVLLKKAERIGKRYKKWELLTRIKIELATELLVAGETAAAAKSFSDFQALARKVNSPAMLRLAAFTMSELYFWQGRILEAIRSYEAVIGDVEDFGDDEATLKDGTLVGWCYVISGRTARGIGMINAVRARAESLGFERTMYIADIMKVHALLEVRKISEAEGVLKNAVSPRELSNIYDHLMKYVALICEAFIMYMKEDYSGAFASHVKASEMLPALGWIPRHTTWTLEYLAGLEALGFACGSVTFRTELERSINSRDRYMKGAALRYQALQIKNGKDDFSKTLADLKESERCLSEVGAEIELARTRLALGNLYLKKGDKETARSYLERAWESFSTIDRNLFPSDLMSVMPKDRRIEFIVVRIGEIARSLGTIRDRSSFLDKALNTAMDFTTAMRGGFFTCESDTLRLIASRNIDPSFMASDTGRIIEESISRAASENKEVTLPASQEKKSSPSKTVARAKPVSSFISIPAILGNHLYGYLYLDNPLDDRPFREDNLPFIRVLCDQIAVGLSNIKMYNEMKELKDRFEEEASFYKQEMGITAPLETIIGQSAPMIKIGEEIRHVSMTDSPVLILGETGVGKELVAKAIHSMSERKDGPFIPVNLAAIPQELIASELFGHEKGAFTGATERRKGRFELADGGTIFLDEIGDLPLNVQPKLLRVLQEGSFERLGASTLIRSNFRIVSATNKNLRLEVEKGTFRQDLFFRLNVLPIYVPPLRERKKDIPPLAHFFLDKYGKKLDKGLKRIPPEEMKKLLNYTWPGNVRELEHAVERAVVLSDGHRISFADFDQTARDTISVDYGYQTGTLADVEKQYIEKVLHATNWKVSGPYGAAAILGLKPPTLAFRMKKLGIKRPGSSSIDILSNMR